jgi:hypothetical protein
MFLLQLEDLFWLHIVEDGGHKILPGRKNDNDIQIVPIDDSLVIHSSLISISQTC